MQKVIEIQCPHCNGEGLYVGMAERDGAAVICSYCKGTGKSEYYYTEFTGRKINPKITRVFKTGQAYIIAGKGKVTLDNGYFINFEKEGVSYEEWRNGKEPKHIRNMGCPMCADQSQCHDLEGFTDVCYNLNGGWIGSFTRCKQYKCLHECWDRFFTAMEAK